MTASRVDKIVGGGVLTTAGAALAPTASSNALALVRLAERGWADGEAVDPALALPVYVRDHVADTIEERETRRASRSSIGEQDRSHPAALPSLREGGAGAVGAPFKP